MDTKTSWQIAIIIFLILAIAIVFLSFNRISDEDDGLREIPKDKNYVPIELTEGYNESYKYSSSNNPELKKLWNNKEPRWRTKNINYSVYGCDERKILQITEMFELIKNKTNVNFTFLLTDEEHSNIKLACSQKVYCGIYDLPIDMKISGCSGIEVEDYGYISGSSIALEAYTLDDEVDKKVMLHEIIHSLGITEHSLYPNSIMYYTTSYTQTFDKNIINKINELYSI